MSPVETVDWSQELPKIKVPTLSIHGEKDFVVDVASMEAIHDPKLQPAFLEGSGHVPAMERSMDVYAAISRYFTAD